MFRSLALALGLTFSLNTLAATAVQDPTLTKSPDGKVLNCERSTDLNRPGYKPTLFYVIPKNDGIQVNVSLAALTCTPDANGTLVLTIRKMNDPLPSMALSGLPATLVFDHQDALLINEHSEILGSREAANELLQAFTYDLSLKQVLSARQLDLLEHGKPVRVHQSFLVRTSSHVETAYGRSEVQTSAGGSYNIEFTLEKVGTKLLISQPVLR